MRYTCLSQLIDNANQGKFDISSLVHLNAIDLSGYGTATPEELELTENDKLYWDAYVEYGEKAKEVRQKKEAEGKTM